LTFSLAFAGYGQIYKFHNFPSYVHLHTYKADYLLGISFKIYETHSHGAKNIGVYELYGIKSSKNRFKKPLL
jgi:hypothetical protein